MAENHKQHRMVIDGAGFVGFNATRELVGLAGDSAEISVINSTRRGAEDGELVGPGGHSHQHPWR
ncbi:MAG TPA: hypothetical protein VF070_35735 [Streptosporangiaceae bacterium]